jgi:hypothetical protein
MPNPPPPCFVICRLSSDEASGPFFKTSRIGYWSPELAKARMFADKNEAEADNFERDHVITWQQAENLTLQHNENDR